MENATVEKRLQAFGLKFAIFFMIFMFSGLVSATEEINFNYPSSVNYGEEFSVDIELIGFNENLYDIKIDVWNSTNRISEIENNGDWKSTMYYVIGAINTSIISSNSFKLNITKNYQGVATINVSVRKSGTTSSVYKFGPYNLEINYHEKTPEENTSNDESSSGENESCEIAKLISFPEILNFGSSDKIKISFDGSCYKFDSAKFLIYGSSSRIISDENDSKIISYASCQGGIEQKISENTEEFSINFNVYSNCNGDYEERVYPIALRICSPSTNWEKYAELFFNISLGKNECNELSKENNETYEINDNSEEVEEILSTTQSDTPSTNTKSKTKDTSKNSVLYSEEIVNEKDRKIYQTSIILFTGTLFIMFIYLVKLKFF